MCGNPPRFQTLLPSGVMVGKVVEVGETRVEPPPTQDPLTSYYNSVFLFLDGLLRGYSHVHSSGFSEDLGNMYS